MIDYRLLQALCAVVEQGGFERAAKLLCLTQSAVSHRIKQLEAIAGQPVLLRTAPPVATPTGQRLLNHLQQVRQMEATLGLEATMAAAAVRIILKFIVVRLSVSARERKLDTAQCRHRL